MIQYKLARFQGSHLVLVSLKKIQNRFKIKHNKHRKIKNYGYTDITLRCTAISENLAAKQHVVNNKIIVQGIMFDELRALKTLKSNAREAELHYMQSWQIRHNEIMLLLAVGDKWALRQKKLRSKTLQYDMIEHQRNTHKILSQGLETSINTDVTITLEEICRMFNLSSRSAAKYWLDLFERIDAFKITRREHWYAAANNATRDKYLYERDSGVLEGYRRNNSYGKYENRKSRERTFYFRLPNLVQCKMPFL